jgi:hypothetical protein
MSLAAYERARLELYELLDEAEQGVRDGDRGIQGCGDLGSGSSSKAAT